MPNDARAAFDLLVDRSSMFVRLHVLVVGLGQREVGQTLLDVLLDPRQQFGVAALPARDPRPEVGASLLDIAPLVEPAEFFQAIVVALSWQMIDGVLKKMHVTALPPPLPGSTREWPS